MKQIKQTNCLQRLRLKIDTMNLKMKYPKDRKQLDDFYKEWYEANKDSLKDTWNRTDVYDFASKYAEKRLFLANVVGQSEQLSCKCGLPKRKEGIGFSCMRTDCDANIAISNNYYDTDVVVDGIKYRIGFDSVYLSLQNNRSTGWELWNLYPSNPTKIGNEFDNKEFKIYMKGVLIYSNAH